MTELGFRMFDADNHYYEAEDAFTRHIPKDMSRRAVQWCEINGRKRLLVGGRVNSFIPNPTFDPIAKPGSLKEFFKGQAQGGKSVTELFGELEPIRPEYRDRDARLSVMDDQGMDACWMFPTLGVGIEAALADDAPAATAAFHAFNQWLDEDWGFAYQQRLFAAPYLCLMDLDGAIAELEWVLARGARVICLRPGPVATPSGTISPFLEQFDPFWARVDEAGITVAFHGGDGGFTSRIRAWEPEATSRAFFATPLQRSILGSLAISETMAALLCHKLLERHRHIRVASIENGSGWVPGLLKKVDLSTAQTPGWFAVKPREIFHERVWVSPFFEDNPAEAAGYIGYDRTLFGSDWPHTEGILVPASYADELGTLPDDVVRRIMRDNAVELTAPVAA